MTKIILSLISLCALSAHAVQEGHGADGVLKDDTVVIADPFLVRDRGDAIDEDGTLFHFSREVGLELVTMRRLLEAYYFEDSKFDQYIFDRKARYYFVDHFDDQRCQNQAQYSVPSTSRLLGAIACTQGSNTWVIREAYAKMNIREQAKLIIHERLRNLPVPAALESIADITDGVDTVIRNYYAEVAGEHPTLAKAEIKKIESLMKAIAKLNLAPNEVDMTSALANHAVLPNGGGLILLPHPLEYVNEYRMIDGYQPDVAYFNRMMTAHLFVAVGTRVDVLMDVGADVEILWSTLRSTGWDTAHVAPRPEETPLVNLGRGVKIFHSAVSSNLIRMAPDSKLWHATIQTESNGFDTGQDRLYGVDKKKFLEERGEFSLGENSIISGTRLEGAFIEIGDHAKITQSSISIHSSLLRFGTNVEVQSVMFYYEGFIPASPNLTMGDNSSLKNGIFGLDLNIETSPQVYRKIEDFYTQLYLTVSSRSIDVPASAHIDFEGKTVCNGHASGSLDSWPFEGKSAKTPNFTTAAAFQELCPSR